MKNKHRQEKTRVNKNDELHNLKIQLKEEQAKNARLNEQLNQLKQKSNPANLDTNGSNISRNQLNYFDNLANPAWEEDFQEVNIFIDKLSSKGITDLQAYFSKHQKQFLELLKKIKILEFNKEAYLFVKDIMGNKWESISSLHDIYANESFESILEQFYAIQNKKDNFETELPVKLSNGEIKYYILRWCVVEGYASYERVLVSLVNITDRFILEKELKETNRRLSNLIGNLTGIVYRCLNNDKRTMSFISNNVFETTGYSPTEILNNQTISYTDVIHPKDRKLVEENLKNALSKENQFTIEYRIITKNGEEKWVWEQGIGVKNKFNEFEFLEGYILDITERKESEQALLESEEKFKAAFKSSPSVIILSDVGNGEIVETNDSFTQVTGWEEHEYLQKPISEIGFWRNPEDRKEYVDLLKKHDSVKNKEYDFRIKSDEVVNALVSGHLLKLSNRTVILSVVTNITEKKKNEDALRKSEILYKAIFKNTGTAACIIDNDHTLKLVNERFEKLLGYSKAELENKRKWSDFASSADLKKMLKYHDARRRTPDEVPNQYEISLIDRKNKKHHILLTVDLIAGTRMSVASLLDISVRINALNELKRSHKKYQNLVEDLSDIFYEIDSNWDFSYLSPSIETLTGYSGNSLIGQPFTEIILPEDRANTGLDFSDLIDKQAFTPFEFRLKTKDNRLVWIRNSTRPVYNEKNEIIGARGIAINITEQKQTEILLIAAKEKAEQADQLKSAFLATMSHELRTPLNAIIGFSHLMDETVKQEDMIEMAKIIYDSGNHLLSIIESIFHLAMLQSKQSPLRIEIFSLSDIHKSLRFYLESELNKQNKTHIEARFNQCVSEFPKLLVQADKTKLTQLLTNFLNNAVKYTDNGSITLGCSAEEKDIIFSVKDSGIGISKEKQELIFERFRQVDDTFTRKYGGVGLGLSICKEISGLLKGNIWLESAPGKGSVFYFRLPNAIFNKAKTKIQ